MGSDRLGEPTEEELIAFAARLLAGSGHGVTDPDVLRETVRDAPRLWRMLYEISQHDTRRS